MTEHRIVKFADVGIKFPSIIEAIGEVLYAGNFIASEQPKFEALFAHHTGAKYAVGVASGTAAITALIEVSLREEYAIPMSERHQYGWIVPAYSYFATAAAVANAGFNPIYVDVESDGLMNQEQAVDQLEEYGDKCLGVVPVHMYGQWMNLDEKLLELSAFTLEDAAQAFGTFAKVQGDGAAFSFYPAKNLGCAGDGGAVISDDWEEIEYIRAWRNQGDLPGTKFNHAILGTNARLDNLQAVILAAKMEEPSFIDSQLHREYVAKHYVDCGIDPLVNRKDNSFHLFPVLLPEAVDRVDMTNFMVREGIHVGNHYPYILPEKVEGWYMASGYPEAEKLAKRVMTLPIGPHMSLLDVEYVVDKFNSYLEAHG